MLNIHLGFDSTISLLGTFPKEMKTYEYDYTKIYTQIPTAALFLIAKHRKQPKVHQLVNW